MRIEKVNENQIRCFLTREDMEMRQLHLKELAYGTEKARKLFRELILKASRQYGFEAENVPVMVEAVPMFDDSLVLIITRVDNPEELDTRFSSFAPSVRSGNAEAESSSGSALGRLLESIREEAGTTGNSEKSTPVSPLKRHPAPAGPESGSGKTAAAPPQLFTFRSLLDASCAAAAADDYSGGSSLYRDPAEAKYYLFLVPDPASEKAAFGRWLSAFSEFGISEYITPAREQHLREHCQVLCAEDAVRMLAALGKN